MNNRIDRSQERKHRRLKLRFGEEKPERIAFIGNASSEGLYIITGQPERVGSLLQLEISLPDGQTVLAEGQVRWAKKVPPNLIRLSRAAGMGVKFTRISSGRETYEEYLAGLHH